MTTISDRIMTTSEIAAHLRVSRDQVVLWREAGVLGSSTGDGVVTVADVRAFTGDRATN